MGVKTKILNPVAWLRNNDVDDLVAVAAFTDSTSSFILLLFYLHGRISS